MNTSIFISNLSIFYMGFIKTLFTGKRDDLSEEEMKKFKEMHSKDNSTYQIENDENDPNTQFNTSSNNINDNDLNISLQDVLSKLELLSKKELIKIKNKIAAIENYKEANVEQDNENNDFETSTSEEYIEFEDSNIISDELNEEFEDNLKEDGINTQSQITNNSNMDPDRSIEEEYENEKNSSSHNRRNDIKINSIESEKNNEPFKFDENEDEVQIFNSNQEHVNSSQEVDPALFSVVHDELMELFEDGEVVLLKQKFTFPTIGERETLAFGVYNTNISNLKDQTHWFIQKLKQFSRLKECKMLLSEENEKDLILEVNDEFAILLSFKTTAKIEDSFEFNTKWN